MTYFLQQVTSGIGIGAVYASMALALVLTYRITKIINFGQGEMATFSTFLVWQLHDWGAPLGLAILGAIAASGVIGVVVYLCVVRPVQYRDELTIIIVTIGILLIFNSLNGAIWGFLQKPLPSVFPSGGLSLGDVRIGYETIGLLVTLIVLSGLLYALFQRTRMGVAFRASASSPESAQLLGIPYTRMVLIGWALAAAVGAISGSLVAPRLTIDPNMMMPVVVFAFCSAVLGGLGSYQGAVIGGILLGVTQVLCVSYLPGLGSDLQIIVPLVVLVVVLAFKPEGLFGKVQVQRV